MNNSALDEEMTNLDRSIRSSIVNACSWDFYNYFAFFDKMYNPGVDFDTVYGIMEPVDEMFRKRQRGDYVQDRVSLD